MSKAKKEDGVFIPQFEREAVTFNIFGRTPIILNRMSEKALREILMPAGRKNAAEKASTLKHNPLEEFRAAPYTLRDDSAPTYLAHLSTAFKGAMRSAALDVPGAAKSQIGRLTFVEGELIPIYGIPRLMMSVTRSANANRTPDIRTRVVIPQWAATITVHFASSLIKLPSVLNLLVQAGITMGVGDWRPEKGSGTFGQFDVGLPDDDDQFVSVMESGGRAAQIAAMADPEPYDRETEEMLTWFSSEVKRRGFKVAA